MTLIKFEPLREIESFQNRIQKYFDELPSFGLNYSENFHPRIDVSEDKENVNVTAEIPGVKKENIKITLQDNILTIEGEKKNEESKEGNNFFRNERTFGSFKRCFTLPVEVDSENVKAQFDNGLLNIKLAKLQPKSKTEKIIELK